MSKRLISMLTVFTMLMTMLSGAAMATDGSQAFDLAAAVEAAEAGSTITLTEDVELTERLTISKELTIDLDGHTISADFEGDYGAVYIGTAGDLTLTNGTVTSAQTYAVGNYGVFTADNVTLECTAENCAALYNFYFNGTTYGKTTVVDGTFGDVWNCGTLAVENGTFDYIDNSGYMTVENAVINGLYGADGTDASEVANCGTIELIGGEVLLGDADVTSAIMVTGDVDLTLDGDIICPDDTAGDGVFHVTAGTLTIDGEGTVNGVGGNDYNMAIWADGGDVVINGGTYTNEGATAEVDPAHFDLIYAKNGSTVTINGGTFIDETPQWTLNSHDTSKGTFIVKGGSFYGYDPSNSETEPDSPVSFVAEGYEVKLEDGYYVVSPTAEKAFLDAVAEGDTVMVEDDIYLDEAVVITKDVTIELNGHSISMTEKDTAGDGVFHVTAGTLTIDGEGTINGVGNNDYNMAIWADGGDVVINGGTYTNVGAGDDDHYDLIYAGSRAGNGGTVTINGGTFIAHTPKWTLNTNDTNGTIEVKGGTFYNYNPADAYSEPEQPMSFVADGYEAKLEDGYYVVSPTAEQAFRDAVAQGGTVTLTEDVQLDSAVVVTKDVTVDLNGHDISMTKEDTAGDGVFHVTGGTLTIEGGGIVDGVGNNDYNMVIWADGGNVVINGGTYTNEGATAEVDPQHFDLIYAKNGSTVTINDGVFMCETPKWTLNSHDTSKGTFIVKGGIFVGFNPSAAMTEPDSPVNFVADGYEVKLEGEYYVIYEKSAPPSDDDDDDDDRPSSPSTPSAPATEPEVTVKDENGQVTEVETQKDGSVIVKADENKQFTVDTKDGEDVKVQVPVEKTNYGLVAVIVNEDGTETVITETIPTENGVEFVVADGQTVKLVDKSQSFDDVAEDGWNHDAVTFAAARGIVNGVGDNKFEPETAATRGMVMTMLARLSGEDTTGGETWFSEGMEWAAQNGISDGTAPEAEITREQLIVMLWRIKGEPKSETKLDSFADGENVSEWAKEAMAWAVETGLIQGSNGSIMAKDSANRDQVAQILMNYIIG